MCSNHIIQHRVSAARYFSCSKMAAVRRFTALFLFVLVGFSSSQYDQEDMFWPDSGVNEFGAAKLTLSVSFDGIFVLFSDT